jgi:IclR family transcriptional regulator, pca regulon regulatory protein
MEGGGSLVTHAAVGSRRTLNESLQKGLAVLAAVAQLGPARLTEVAARAGIDYTTAYRMISTLASLGYVRRDALTKRYEVGPAVLQLGYAYVQNLRLSQVALPVMRQLRDALQETVNLSVLDGEEMVLLESVEGRHLLSTRIRIGGRFPLHCAASGKVALASLPPEERARILATLSLSPHTSRTITHHAALATEIARVRELGYGLNNEELAVGLTAVAAPIWDYRHSFAGSLDVPVPTVRATAAFLEARVIPAVVRAATQVSHTIGGHVDGAG